MANFPEGLGEMDVLLPGHSVVDPDPVDTTHPGHWFDRSYFYSILILILILNPENCEKYLTFFIWSNNPVRSIIERNWDPGEIGPID